MAFKGLFIGIDRYASAEINWLSCAIRDAKALHGLFTDTLGGDTLGECRSGGAGRCSHKKEMTKTIERWLLFTFEHGEFTPLLKPFKTKKQAEKERLKYPEGQHKSVGLGMIRTRQ